MRYFTANGLWFRAEDPKTRVAGTLRYSKHGLHLRLLGEFTGGWSPRTEPYPLIHGIVSKNPHGEFMTLIDCFTTRKTLSFAGIGSETIYCTWGVAGNAYLSPRHDQFEALDVTLSYLTDWFGRRGIVSQAVLNTGEYGLDVRYRKPETVRFPIDDAVLSLGMEVRSKENLHVLSISEEAHLIIKPLPRLNAEQVVGEFVRSLQDLLSFATDTPNEIEAIELREGAVVAGHTERSRKYYLYYNPIFRLETQRRSLAKRDMLFTFDEAQEAKLNIFQQWFKFESQHRAFCTMYFALLYAPPKSLDEKFIMLMSAFTHLSASLGDVSRKTRTWRDGILNALSACFTEEERLLLEHIPPTDHEIEMPFHLLRLLEEYRPLMGQIIGNDFPGFVRSISDTLDFVKRRISAEGRHPLQGDDLYYAMQRIHVLIKIVLLNKIGFDINQISLLIERNAMFSHIKLFNNMN